MNSKTDSRFNLTAHGLTLLEVHRNLPTVALYENAIRYEKDASIAENGAQAGFGNCFAGVFTEAADSRAHQIHSCLAANSLLPAESWPEPILTIYGKP
jgi:hypothetical protein